MLRIQKKWTVLAGWPSAAHEEIISRDSAGNISNRLLALESATKDIKSVTKKHVMEKFLVENWITSWRVIVVCCCARCCQNVPDALRNSRGIRDSAVKSIRSRSNTGELIFHDTLMDARISAVESMRICASCGAKREWRSLTTGALCWDSKS